MQSTCKYRRAFTLVELLVVVAIIALLIGILLPALSNAQTASRRTATLARLRDMGMGCSAYSMDYKGELPALESHEEKAFLGLSVLAKQNEVPFEAFININTADTPATHRTKDERPILAERAGAEVTADTVIVPGDIPRIAWHCSFAYDNDIILAKAKRMVVYIGDRADYATGATFSANWNGKGMCLLWTDQHAAFSTTRTMSDQGDPNIYHHNEFGGEGAGEVRDGVGVTSGTVDTHLRFFSEDEDDVLLPN